VTIPGITGGVTLPGHVGTFAVTRFGFSVTRSSPTAPPAWTLGASVDATGAAALPTLYLDAANKEPFSPVEFQFAGATGTPIRVNLTNAVILGTATTVTATTTNAVTVALTFEFDKIEIAVGADNITFDRPTNKMTGSPGSSSTHYAYGARIPGDEVLDDFTPPSEQIVARPGGTETSFGTSSLGVAVFDQASLASLSLVLSGKTMPKADVSIYHAVGTAPIKAITYLYEGISPRTVSVSGLATTVDFTAQNVQWSTASVTGPTLSTGWDLSSGKPL
jgi:hypothetical protein